MFFNLIIRAFVYEYMLYMTYLRIAVEHSLLQDIILSRVALLVKDIDLMYGRKLRKARKEDNWFFFNIYFHNKGVEMITFPSVPYT